MIGFIVPLKGKEKSKNWYEDSLLLKKTLISICAQTSPNFMVVVVYTDMPLDPLIHDKIEYLKFPFSFVTNEILTLHEQSQNPKSNAVIDERAFDQGKRILYGCTRVKMYCKYVMSVDADDLISNQIVEFILKDQVNNTGWYVDKGYILKGKSNWLIKVRKNMNDINGSTNIINTELLPNVNFNSYSLYEFSFFSAHAYLKHRIFNSVGKNLVPLPFPAIIYRLHNNNWTEYKSLLERQFFKTLIKYLIKGKPINKQIEKEFSIY